MSCKVYVYFNDNQHDIPVGTLFCHRKGRVETASFIYNEKWLAYQGAFSIDPLLPLGAGVFYTQNPLFGIFTDCAPDRWGEILIRRFENDRAGLENRAPKTLNKIDYMLMVNDYLRQGAFRFKLDEKADFMFAPDIKSIPPLIQLPQLLAASDKIHTDSQTYSDLKLLLAPGSSLGGARPKATVIDKMGNLCIAKFPKIDDEGNVVLLEALALTLAKKAGLNTPAWQLVKANGKDVLVIHRFDREKEHRIPFASAMTLLGAKDGDSGYSYVDIAGVIRQYSASPTADLNELWARLVFSILISNTDDHLRNHGFLRYDNKGYRLSPIYDINPCLDNIGYLHTPIFKNEYSASLQSALQVCAYFDLSAQKAQEMIVFMQKALKNWQNQAQLLGISMPVIKKMAPAFHLVES